MYLLRHGETNFNKEGRCQGQSQDSKLTQTGKQQILDCIPFLSSVSFQVIDCSDLVRALESRDLLLESLSFSESKTSPELRERQQGELEGMLYQSSEWRKYQKLLKEGADLKNFFKNPPESTKEFEARIIKHILPYFSYENVLIITHGGVIRNLLSFLLKKDFHPEFSEKESNLLIPNGAIIRISKNKEFYFAEHMNPEEFSKKAL